MRTVEEMIKIAKAIKEEADNLPEENFFGESNTEIIEDSLEIVKQLGFAIDGKMELIDHEEVSTWIEGSEYSMLNDYE